MQAKDVLESARLGLAANGSHDKEIVKILHERIVISSVMMLF